MITEQQLKDRCTPDDIKRMVELAEGFEYLQTGSKDISLHYIKTPDGFKSYFGSIKDYEYTLNFSTLIHRAVEGWNFTYNKIAFYPDQLVKNWNDGMINVCIYSYDDYQPQSLTQTECAILDCLLDIFEEEKN
jgi:hypothetical protein